MAKASYTAIIEQAGDGTWGAYVPDLPTIITNGKTRDEVEANVREAIEIWIEEMTELGQPIPAPTSLAVVVQVAA